jgi:hypothetical protein
VDNKKCAGGNVDNRKRVGGNVDNESAQEEMWITERCAGKNGG